MKFREERDPKIKAKIARLYRKAKKEEARVQQTYTESDYQAKVFADWIDAHERVYPLLIAAERRYREIIRDLNEHRSGLGEWLCRADARIIDHEADESSISGAKQAQDSETVSAACTAASMPSADSSTATETAPAIHPRHEAGGAEISKRDSGL